MSTLATVRRIIASETDLKVEDLDSVRPLGELGVDSLSVAEVMFKLEDEFHIKTPDERVPIRTIQDIADLIDRLVAEAGAGAATGRA